MEREDCFVLENIGTDVDKDCLVLSSKLINGVLPGLKVILLKL